MYDELKERCRACSQGCNYPSECSYFGKPPLRCMRQLLSEAADAIESMSEAYDKLSRHMDDLAALMPRWIPVTERLPEEYKDVLCYYEYFRYGDYNCMFRTIDRGYYGNGRWGGEAGQGHKNKVLAWMPLPSTEGLNEA